VVEHSIHRCRYKCYQRSQFTEDNAEPSLCQFTVTPNHLQVACANHTYVGEVHNRGQSTSLTQSGVLWEHSTAIDIIIIIIYSAMLTRNNIGVAQKSTKATRV